MVQVSYPGVYVQEKPSGVRAIATVSTSVAAFVDYFTRGPMDEAVEIFGMADFDRIFGGLQADSEASYAISQFFLNGGSRAYVVRVAHGTTRKASVLVQAITGAGDVFAAQAASEGSWGNHLRVRVEHNEAGDAFDLYVAEDSGGRSLAQEKHLNLSASGGPRYFPTVIGDASRLIDATHEASGSVLPAPNGLIGDEINVDFATDADVDALKGTFTATVTRSTGALTPLSVTLAWADAERPRSVGQLARLLEQAIRRAANAASPPLPALAGATVRAAGKRLVVRSNPRATGYEASELVTSDSVELKLSTGVANVQEYVLGAGAVASTHQSGGQVGTDGSLPGAGELRGDPDLKTGMFALKNVDLFNILCLPRASELNASSMEFILAEATTFCEEQRAMLLVDIPETIRDVAAMKAWMADNGSLRHRNLAVFFPRALMPDPLDEFRLRSVGASGTMAGVFARTDAQRGVWQAPAGVDAQLRGLGDLDYHLIDEENGVLNPLGINCLRTFPVEGRVSWGTRTLVGADEMADEWKYIPIRRLALLIEESLFRGTKWAVFQPNDEPLWALLRQNVGAFMNRLFRQGAFQGASPREAYYVKCDKETNPPDNRNLGIVTVEVGFAPLKPAEFVVITIQQIPDVG